MTMKTPEEMKKGLAYCMNRDCAGVKCPYYNAVSCNTEKIRDALVYIQDLESRVPRWISVEERLPEDDANVLVYAIGNNENSCIAMTSYTHNLHGFHIEGWRSPWQYFFYEHTITHWMPLPSTEGLHDN